MKSPGQYEGIWIVENHYRWEPYGAGSKVTLFLLNLGIDILITPMDYPKGKAILEAGGVRIVKVEARRKVEKVLRSLQSSL